ncbi:hypothetical protein [Thermotoga sp. KOL6]|uniref:hypothetical protein n=1 Tax=Thermotoga sp. KOL6 TaxID=126741 RepID=UPI000C7666BE|nr:hypothetical protein [Thermotoga sp. KOL6]PLV58062.1 hypothetical protein AS005_08615 [Thermotoga sp. KOL6]
MITEVIGFTRRAEKDIQRLGLSKNQVLFVLRHGMKGKAKGGGLIFSGYGKRFKNQEKLNGVHIIFNKGFIITVFKNKKLKVLR